VVRRVLMVMVAVLGLLTSVLGAPAGAAEPADRVVVHQADPSPMMDPPVYLCGPSNDGEIIYRNGAWWKCRYLFGGWIWVQIPPPCGCGCVISGTRDAHTPHSDVKARLSALSC
jgi:hypothetical protein